MDENVEEKKKTKKKKSIPRKILRFLIWFLGGIFLLIILLLIVLSTPYAQNKITSIASTEVGKLLNTNVKFGSINYKLFNYISINNVYIADQNNDTLAFAKSIEVGIKPWDYIKNGQITVDEAIIDGLYINAVTKDSISAYNYQFIIDEFSSTDTLQTDTSSTSIQLEIYNFELKNSRLKYIQIDKIDTFPTFNPYDIELNDINAKLIVKSIDPQALDIEVEKLRAHDRSGFTISNISGDVKSKKDKYYIENLKIETPNSYLQPSVLSYDLSADIFNIDLTDGKLFSSDFIAFSPNAKYLTQNIYPTIQANGMLPTIQVSKLGLRYGDYDILDASAFLSTYEDLTEASLELDITKLSMTPEILTDMIKLGDESFEMPKDINLGTIEGHTILKGELSELYLDGELNITNGVLNWDITGKIDTSFTSFDIDANVSLLDAKLGKILNTDQVKDLSMNINIKAHQEEEEQLFVDILGSIDNLILKKGKITDFPFMFSMDPKRYALKFAKSFTFGAVNADLAMTKDDLPDLDIKLQTHSFRIAHFIDYETWTDPILDFNLDACIKSFDIDNLNIDASIDQLRIKDLHFDYAPGKITLKAWKDENKTQFIKLNSSIIDFDLEGKYAFSTLSDELSTLLNPYLPIIFPKVAKQSRNNFDMKLSLYNTKILSRAFDLPATIEKTIKATSKINTIDKQLSFDVNMPLASMDSTAVVRQAKLSMNVADTVLLVDFQTGLDAIGSKFKIGMNVAAFQDTIFAYIKVKSDSANLRLDGDAKFKTYLHKDAKGQIIADVDVTPTDIRLKDFIINLLPAKINNTGNKIYVENVGLGLNGRSFFSANGTLSPEVSDTLKLNFTQAEVHDILNGFDVDNIYAEIDGEVRVVSTMNQPSVLTDNLSVKNITLYGDTIGTILMQSIYNSFDKLVHVHATLTNDDNKTIEFGGQIDPITTLMDFKLDVNKFSIGWLKPFVSEYLTEISGLLNSKISITGTKDAPITEGFLGIARTKFGVAYTNTSYFISDTIEITPKTLGLKNLEVTDIDGNSAMLNAKVTHNNFKNIKFDLGMRAKNLMVLNTMNRKDSLFFGKVFASGDIDISGSLDAVNMKMKVNNAKKSNLYITIPQVSEADEYTNIVFINTPEESNTKVQASVAETNIPMDMNINLTVDPNIKFTIVIDPKTNDKLEAVGNGNINFKYNMENELMTLFGDYTISSGFVRLNLQSVYNIEFKIKEGSKLQFIGDPMKTKFNITAYKRVKADLKSLDASTAQNYSNSRVNVDCLLEISGDIDNMDLNYNVQLVGASDDQENLFNSLVNTSDAKIRQFAFLVTAGSFYPATSSTSSNFANGMWTSIASSAISAGLNSVLTSVLGNNWNFAADISDGSKSVTAQTNLFNDKLVVSANVGYKDGSDVNNANTQNQFIGDFDVTYLLSPQWSLKAYSHMNNDITRQGSTIQGVGVTYTKDARTFRRLFETSKKKQSRTNRAWMVQQSRMRMDSVIDSIKIKPNPMILSTYPIDSIGTKNRLFDSIKMDTVKVNIAKIDIIKKDTVHSIKSSNPNIIFK